MVLWRWYWRVVYRAKTSAVLWKAYRSEFGVLKSLYHFIRIEWVVRQKMNSGEEPPKINEADSE